MLVACQKTAHYNLIQTNGKANISEFASTRSENISPKTLDGTLVKKRERI
jgi:hypothetical protein